MNRVIRRIVVASAAAAALFLSGCAGPIPVEKVPEGWALNVHQPGEWWTQALIPRSVVVQRCPPKPGWASEPDLRTVTALPPGGDVNYSLFNDDYHCLIGWSEAPSEVTAASVAELTTEAGLRRICSSTGLPMDAGWRFVGRRAMELKGDLSWAPETRAMGWDAATAAFTDEHNTVVACLADYQGEAGTRASVALSVGGEAAAFTNGAVCPVRASNLGRNGDGTADEYHLRGAGTVRGDDGRVLTGAATLTLGLVGDSLTTSHPVLDGIAVVDARIKPAAAVPFEDWDHPPAVEGQILDKDGKLLATCRA